MYVECRNCFWCQDDFWTDKDNPIRDIIGIEKELLNFEKMRELTYKHSIVLRIHEMLIRIENMKFYLPEDIKCAKCPECDTSALVIMEL